MHRVTSRLFGMALLSAAIACNSTASPSGTVQLQLGCTSIVLPRPSGMGECTVRLIPVGGQTGTIEAVTLIGANGQPISQAGGFRYGSNLGLRVYSRPTPSDLAGQAFGPAAFAFDVVAVLSEGDGETLPSAGSYPAAVRVTHRLSGGNAETVEVGVPVLVQ